MKTSVQRMLLLLELYSLTLPPGSSVAFLRWVTEECDQLPNAVLRAQAMSLQRTPAFLLNFHSRKHNTATLQTVPGPRPQCQIIFSSPPLSPIFSNFPFPYGTWFLLGFTLKSSITFLVQFMLESHPFYNSLKKICLGIFWSLVLFCF
jgi:hypothetical protein